MLPKKTGSIFWVCIVSIALLTGCGGDNKPVSVKPEKLVVYSAVNAEYMLKVASEFEKDTGIKVESVRLSAGEMVARVREEKNSPKATIVYGGSADGYIQMKDEGLLEKYVSPQAAAIPSTLKDPAGYWTGIYVGYIGFVSNKKVLAERAVPMPTSWNDLLRPELKGQVALANPGTAGAAYTMLATLVQLKGETDAMKYMKELDGQVTGYEKSAVSAAQMAGEGKVAVGVAFLQDAIRFQEQGMKDIVISTPNEGTGFEIGAVGIVREGPDQAAARKFVDWALSKKAQELGLGVDSYRFPTLPDAKSPADAESIRTSTKLIIYDFGWAGKNRKQLIDKWNALTK